MRFDPADDEPSLIFYCGELPVDDTIIAADMEPNGYFWEGVLRFADPSLSEGLEFDSEADMFCVYGNSSDLAAVRELIEPLLTDTVKIRDLIERAETADFDLEDSEPIDPEPRRSLFSRLFGRR